MKRGILCSSSSHRRHSLNSTFVTPKDVRAVRYWITSLMLDLRGALER